MKPKIVIVGAGGHAKVVCDTIMHLNIYEIVGFIDIAKSNNVEDVEKELVEDDPDSMFSAGNILKSNLIGAK
jgi:FlaA1/EpsC-like NDP-sugar epimerase